MCSLSRIPASVSQRVGDPLANGFARGAVLAKCVEEPDKGTGTGKPKVLMRPSRVKGGTQSSTIICLAQTKPAE
jgi:hypothetical protein